MSTLYQAVAGIFIPLGLALVALGFISDEFMWTLITIGVVFSIGGFVSLFLAIKRDEEERLDRNEQRSQLMGLLREINSNLKK